MHSFIIISRPLCDIGRRQHDLYLGACNLLHLNGQDLRDLAVEERREILHGLIPAGSRIQSSEEILGDGDAVFYLVDKAGIRRNFSKRRGSKYYSIWRDPCQKSLEGGQ